MTVDMEFTLLLQTFKIPELVSVTAIQKPSVQHTELASAGAA